MRTKSLVIVSVALAVVLIASPLFAGTWEGTLKVGQIFLDDEGDLSTVQEAYNIHDGFSLTQLRLTGAPSPRSHLMLDLREMNLDSRKGYFIYRNNRLLKLSGSYDQHRQVFGAGSVDSERRDWSFDGRLTPVKWLRLSGSYGDLRRDGERLSYPAGTSSVLGTKYDNALRTVRASAEARKDRHGIAVDYRYSNFSDDLNSNADRTGKVFSARLFTPGYFLPDKVTHVLRAAYGVSELSTGELDYKLGSFQYTGVLRLLDQFQFRYNFDTQRVDNESTDRKTDRIQNNVDATFYYKDGSVTAGYGYETNDDDHALTRYDSWRVGATFRGEKHSAKFRYAGRDKKDKEELTLLKDVETSRFLADLEVRPIDDLDLGMGLNARDREFPDIGVKSKGHTVRGTAGYSYPNWGRLSGTYTYSDDEYTDLAAGYDVNSHIITARVDLERIKDLRLSSGVTWLDASKDVDIEKSVVFFEGVYTVKNDFHFEAKYNIYNYDDFILLDRFYTANVVWFNVGYDFQVE